MTTQPTILVTGATGNIGRYLVSELLPTGVTVRALVREPAAAKLPRGVEVVRGDLAIPDTLDAALRGVDTVFLLWPFVTAEATPAVLNVIKKDARRIVYLSSMNVNDDADEQTDPITTFHAVNERLIARSGLDWTFLRSGGIATNTLGWAAQIRDTGVVRWPSGEATRSLIHERDIAAVAAHVLTAGGYQSAKLVLTGPQALSQIEQVRLIGEAIGRPLRYEEQPPEEARQQLLAAGWPQAVIAGSLDAWAAMATTPEPGTQTVEEITGTPARPFRQWALDHAADFR